MINKSNILERNLNDCWKVYSQQSPVYSQEKDEGVESQKSKVKD